MSQQLEFVFLQVGVVVVAVMSVLASKKIEGGGSQFWYYIPGFLTIALWALIAKRSPYSMLVTSTTWNVIYDGVWTMTLLVFFRGAASVWQAAGACLVVAGCIVMSLGGE